MQKVTWLVSLVLLLGVTAMAQETPKAEVFGGYSHFVADVGGTSINMNGFHVSVRENLNSWFGGDLDFSTNYGTEAGFNVNTQSIMYGPVFAYRKRSRVTPFAHVLLGAVRGSDGFVGISKSATKVGVAPGGDTEGDTPELDEDGGEEPVQDRPVEQVARQRERETSPSRSCPGRTRKREISK